MRCSRLAACSAVFRLSTYTTIETVTRDRFHTRGIFCNFGDVACEEADQVIRRLLFDVGEDSHTPGQYLSEASMAISWASGQTVIGPVAARGASASAQRAGRKLVAMQKPQQLCSSFN